MNPAPHFWSTPLKYCRWASRERPAIFWSVIIGAIGPIGMVVGPPIRRWCGDIDPPLIPTTYPVPTGPRKILTGFDDDDEEDVPSDNKQSS
ncbi:NADH-ubiquinone oxidoreductase 9.5 kDa subunit [Ophiocordyceps camponoti-floridani]|uniref:NADH-ubiquinone oxidoreductase 9.5 kDa subunit n=1 Tax=Ophiocordyceps camponoti-floridani TaxID=2030778 RepID=A0A8H4Q5R0_9HYPO|nr:NADH-ubiquinone oxidoreductase 9.5 kDa subunit [Ophiocordyceps camponoti-floridani]